jgi:hypothetical protein
MALKIFLVVKDVSFSIPLVFHGTSNFVPFQQKAPLTYLKI